MSLLSLVPSWGGLEGSESEMVEDQTFEPTSIFRPFQMSLRLKSLIHQITKMPLAILATVLFTNQVLIVSFDIYVMRVQFGTTQKQMFKCHLVTFSMFR